MYLRDIKCPHCGREFVDYARLAMHLANCAELKQRELDEEFFGPERRSEKIAREDKW